MNASSVLVLAMALSLFLPVSGMVKTLIVCLLAVILVIFKRSSLIYVRAARGLVNQKGNAKKHWANLEKAAKMGLPDQMLMTAASIFIQKGDYHKGCKILDDFIAKASARKLNGKVATQRDMWIATAKTMRSMVFWMDGDLDGAIAQMKEVHDTGSKNQNVFINYGTYVLEKGDLQTAKMLIEESKETEIHSNGLKDNHGWYEILRGNWKAAEAIYEELMEKNPSFPEAYVHLSQIRIHQGRIADALALLEKAEGCKFTQTSGMRKETVQKLHALLKDGSTRLQTAESIDADPLSVASGKLPLMIAGSWPFSEADQITPFGGQGPIEEIPQSEAPTVPQKEDDADRLPDTSLDDSDEAYLKSHGLA